MIQTWHQEGKAIFKVGTAFYRPRSAPIRDFGILSAAAFRQKHGRLTLLDGMTGCGVRSLRYALEAGADFIHVNDGNTELNALIKDNLARHLPGHRYQLTSLSIQRLLAGMIHQGDRVDWIDLDCFGTPADSLPLAIAATHIGGCLYLTATDGKSLSGQQSQAALRQFGSYTRHHSAVHEQGIRVLIGLAVQHARQQGLDVIPLFSLFCGQTYRVLLRLLPKAPTGDKDYGFLGYCHHCGQFHQVPWRSLSQTQCNLHEYQRSLVLSGPMWLGPLHEPAFLAEMLAIAQEWNWKRPMKLLRLMQTESHFPPYYFPLSEIGRRGQMDIPARDKLIQSLLDSGYQACQSSIEQQAIKTNASLPEIITISRGMHSLKQMSSTEKI